MAHGDPLPPERRGAEPAPDRRAGQPGRLRGPRGDAALAGRRPRRGADCRASSRDLDGLVIPGGESTTIAKAIERDGLESAIRAHADSGRPILGTCAGMIICDREHLGLVDATARRNAFGRQIASFELELEVGGVGPDPMRAVFIRAPWIEDHGAEVEVLAQRRRPPGGRPPGPDRALCLPSGAHRRLAPARATDGARHLVPRPFGERRGNERRAARREGPSRRQPGPDPGSLLDRGQGGRDLPDRRAHRRRAPDRRRLRGGSPGRRASGGRDLGRRAGRDLLQACLGRPARVGLAPCRVGGRRVRLPDRDRRRDQHSGAVRSSPGAPIEAPQGDPPPDGEDLAPRRRGDAPVGLHPVPDQWLRRRRRDEPGRVRGLLLPSVPGH